MIDGNTTLLEMLEICRKSNAGTVKLVLRDDNGRPFAAFIAVDGFDETKEILDVVEVIEDGWN